MDIIFLELGGHSLFQLAYSLKIKRSPLKPQDTQDYELRSVSSANALSVLRQQMVDLRRLTKVSSTFLTVIL